MLNHSSGLGRVLGQVSCSERLAALRAARAHRRAVRPPVRFISAFLACARQPRPEHSTAISAARPAANVPSRAAYQPAPNPARPASRRVCASASQPVSSPPVSAQPNANQAASNPVCVPPAAAACLGRSGRGRSGARRPDQARRRRHRQETGRPRPRAVAGAQSRLRRRRLLRAVLGAVAAMRADHLVDPADARRSRPHDQ